MCHRKQSEHATAFILSTGYRMKTTRLLAENEVGWLWAVQLWETLRARGWAQRNKGGKKEVLRFGRWGPMIRLLEPDRKPNVTIFYVLASGNGWCGGGGYPGSPTPHSRGIAGLLLFV